MSKAAFCIIGSPLADGILIVADHASNNVPDDVRLGIDPACLDTHIAIDLGVAAVAGMLVQQPDFSAFLGNVSRLVCDFNREEDAPGVIPLASDGIAIPGNEGAREDRMARFYHPYHQALTRLIGELRPGLILSLHSFTPLLASQPDQKRPWHVGVLYNQDDRAAQIALPLLKREGLTVGDQQPYSGKLLNATMNRHAEANGIPYLGIEIRQDQLCDAAGAARWAEILEPVARACCNSLANQGDLRT